MLISFRNYMLLALSVFILFPSISLSQNKDTSADLPKLSWEISKDDRSMYPFKRSVDVEINRPTTESILRAIAVEIKSMDSRQYDRTFICYNLPDYQGNGAWAISHFNPSLKVEVLGMSLVRYKKLLANPAPVLPGKAQLIGQWIDNRSYMGPLLIIETDSQIQINHEFRDGTVWEEKVRKEESPRGLIFWSLTHDEWYIINKKGDLEMWDTEGLIYTASRFDR